MQIDLQIYFKGGLFMTNKELLGAPIKQKQIPMYKKKRRLPKILREKFVKYKPYVI